MKALKRLSPARIIALGFALTILIGSVLLMLPCCVKPGVQLKYIDSLYTTASAVCVTGLLTVDVGDTFTTLGQIIVGLLIQIGGLGISTVGAGVILAVRRNIDLKSKTVVKEAVNMSSGSGVLSLLREIFAVTAFFEIIGAILSFTVFIHDYPFLKAVGLSLFHSVAAFNNSGFDIFGGMRSLTLYSNNIMLNLVTCILIFFGGIGFLVIREMRIKRIHWKKYSMHAKVVISLSVILTVGGMIMFRLTENVTWLEALFQSVSARTAGFYTYPLGKFSNAGIIMMILLMFIGASPGSTGGGVKTSTVFVLFQAIKSSATGMSEGAFHYSVSKSAFRKAAVVTLLGLSVVVLSTYLFCAFEPDVSLRDAVFEMTSAFGTVGLSTGITPQIGSAAKILTVIMMYIGRLGPLTVASLWYFSGEQRVRYPYGEITVG